MYKKILVGLITGFISGLLATGGGLILLPACTYVFKLNEKESRATTIFSMLIIIIVTSIIYLKYKNFDIILGIKCAIGGIIGSYIGSKLLNKINTKEKIFKIIFILFLVYSSYCMLR